MQDLRCPIENHNKKRFVSVHLNDISDKRFHCFQCQSDTTSKLTQSSLNTNELCDLDEVMDNNHYSVYNWPVDPVGKKVKETLQQFKTPEQQKKEIEDFFLQAKQKLNEQLDTIKQLLLEAVIVNQPIKDDKNAPKADEGKDQKKDDKKDSKKDDKKDTKKDDKKDSKKEEPVKLDQKEPEKLDLSPTGENLKKFYDQVYDLTRIKQIIKEGAKGDSKVMSDKISEYLNDPKRKENLTHLKDIHQRFLANTDKKSELPTGKEVTQIFQDQIERAVQQWIYLFGKVNWKFEQSKAGESDKLKILDNGIEFKGAASQSQIIYSSQAFSQGQHGCIMIFQEFDASRTTRNGNFFVGLVSEDKKDKKDYGHDYRKCLFTGNGEGLITKVGQDFNAVFKGPPKLLSIKVDVDNDLFEVSDGKRSVAYGLDRESKLKNKQWRIYLYWKDASDRVRLIHSY